MTEGLNVIKTETQSGETRLMRERPSYIRTEGVRHRPGVQHAGIHRNDNSSQKNSLFLTGIQAAACTAFVIGAVIFKQFGGAAFVDAKSFAKDAITNGITITQVQEALHSLRSQFPDAAEVFSSGVTSSSAPSNSSSNAASSASVPSSSVNTSSISESSAASSAASSASKAPSISSISGGKIIQTGGEDIGATNLTLEAAKKLPPPSTVSLATVNLSTTPYMPVVGSMSCNFGYRINPITKKVSFHTGVDLAAPEGTPILAALSGTVEKTGVSTAYGNYIKIKDSGGIETFYGHCKKVLVKNGQKISKGQKIGTVGTTGMSTGYHLHFGILKNGLYVDPQKILKL